MRGEAKTKKQLLSEVGEMQQRIAELEASLRERTRVEEELGLSYPTVRSRLNDVIRALGYEVPAEAAISTERRQSILEQVQAGEITAGEAVELLKGSGA